jgi:thiosulfate dehydrogenase [quinone] large subunit
MIDPPGPTRRQQLALVVLRMAVGWHLLYDAWNRLWDAGATSAGFLAASRGPLGPLFRELAAHGRVLNVLERFAAASLAAAGLGLLLGFATRTSARVAAAFLVLFYLVNPPFPGVDFLPGEGAYLLVNKTLVEVLALGVLALFPTGQWIGLDRFLDRYRQRPRRSVAAPAGFAAPPEPPARPSDPPGRWS